jgi:hypothetical protein
MSANNTLHVYAQEHGHAEAYLVGTRAALDLLRTAIDEALQMNFPTCIEVFAVDGEGYRVTVVPTDEARLLTLHLPYRDDCASAAADATKYWPGEVWP